MMDKPDKIVIIPTEFKDVRRKKEKGPYAYGVRVSDGHGCYYIDENWPEIPENDLEIIDRVFMNIRNLDNFNPISSIVVFLINNKVGIYVGDLYYSWEVIKPILKRWSFIE